MIPKKSSEIINLTAEELNCSESKVDAVVSFYYKNLRKELSSLSEILINVPALGYFQIKPSRVKDSISKIKKELEEFKTDSFNQHVKKNHLEEKLLLLNNINVKIDDFLNKKKEIRNEQAKYYLEKQKTNNGRN